MDNTAKYELPRTLERKLFHIPVQTVKNALNAEQKLATRNISHQAEAFRACLLMVHEKIVR